MTGFSNEIRKLVDESMTGFEGGVSGLTPRQS